MGLSSNNPLTGLYGVVIKATAAGVTVEILNSLKDYKYSIMNPNSHYYVEQPLFKTERKSAIQTLDRLKVELNYPTL